MKKILLVLSIILLFGCAGASVEVVPDVVPFAFEDSEYSDHNRTIHVRAAYGATAAFKLPLKIYEIDGVASIIPGPYSVRIIKGHQYSWAEIMLEVDRIMKDFREFEKTFDPDPDEPEVDKKHGA